jgi:hypothetical protein
MFKPSAIFLQPGTARQTNYATDCFLKQRHNYCKY